MTKLKCLNEAFLTVTQYAKKHKVSSQRIRFLIKNGRLLCGKVGWQWMIPANEKVKGWKNERF